MMHMDADMNFVCCHERAAAAAAGNESKQGPFNLVVIVQISILDLRPMLYNGIPS